MATPEDITVEADIATIDEYLTSVTGRNIIPAGEVSDILLDVRSTLAKYRVNVPDEIPYADVAVAG